MVKAVLFDWDGTLVDTAEASYRCYVRLFSELGIPFDRATYARTYSPNWYQTFRAVNLPEERWAWADSRWLAHFATERVGIVDGARDLIELLARHGIAMGIVTSGSSGRVAREIDAHGLGGYLRACVYGCDVEHKKPHPEGLHLCLERLGVTAEESVYVGDSPEDIQMAKAAGVRAIAVPGGYPNEEALREAEPDAFAASLRDVATCIFTLAGERPAGEVR